MSWQPIETAPADGTKVLFYGRWLPYDILPGGEPYICTAQWSSLMSDGVSGYKWYVDGLCALESINVKFTHWRPLPEAPTP